MTSCEAFRPCGNDADFVATLGLFVPERLAHTTIEKRFCESCARIQCHNVPATRLTPIVDEELNPETTEKTVETAGVPRSDDRAEDDVPDPHPADSMGAPEYRLDTNPAATIEDDGSRCPFCDGQVNWDVPDEIACRFALFDKGPRDDEPHVDKQGKLCTTCFKQLIDMIEEDPDRPP